MIDQNLAALLAGPDAGPLEKVMLALIQDPSLDTRIDSAVAGSAVILRVGPKRLPIFLLKHTPEDPTYEARLRAAARHCQQEPTELVVFGGPHDVREAIRRAAPGLQQNRLGAYHVDNALKVFMVYDGSKLSPLWDLLGKLERSELTVAPFDPGTFAAKIRRDAATVDEQGRQVHAFRAFLAGRKPIATWILLGAIAAMYLLTMLAGGTDDTRVLLRAGALSSEAVRDGEWWRLLSAAFLHGGPVHLLMNGAVLFTLGSTLERLLGTRRFVVLYALSALGGSVASALIRGNPLSVGASGALWGLLAAEAVIAFRPAGLIPAFQMSNMRTGVLSTLALNVIVSFQPGVDFAAHLGGGVVGALLMVSGLLTQGSPRLDDLAPGAAWPAERRPGWLTPAFGLMSLALAGSVVIALVTGRPWELKEGDTTLTMRPIPELKLTIAMPSIIAERPYSMVEGGVLVGDVRRDGIVVGVASKDLAAGLELPALIDGVKKEFETPPNNGKALGAPTHVTVEGREIVTAVFTFENRVRIERAAFVSPGRVVIVDVLVPPFSIDRFTGLAQRMAATVVLDQGAPPPADL